MLTRAEPEFFASEVPVLVALGLLLLVGRALAARDGRRGRPSKLTASLQEQMVGMVRDGAALEVAAVATGIHRSTLFDWLRRGRAASRLWEQGEVVPESEAIFLSFADALETARAEGEVSAVRVVRRAMVDDYRAAQWYLERSHPERWARHRIDISVAAPPDDHDVVSAGKVAGYLASLEPGERARVVWDAIVAASADADPGQEFAVGQELRDAAQHRLALNAADEGSADDPSARTDHATSENAEGADR